jgi:hypothetical protein
MKRCLILGCSFSLGSWEYDGKKENRIPNSIAWYHNILPEDEWTITVASHPAGGYIQYASLISMHKLSEIDLVIIQETWEPRILLTESNELNRYNTDSTIYDNVEFLIHNSNNWLFQPHMQAPEHKKLINRINAKYNCDINNTLKYLYDISNCFEAKTLIHSTQLYCDNVLKGLKIPSYSFCYPAVGPEPMYEHIQKLTSTTVEDLFFYDSRYHNFNTDTGFIGHMNEEGNMAISKWIGPLIREIVC